SSTQKILKSRLEPPAAWPKGQSRLIRNVTAPTLQNGLEARNSCPLPSKRDAPTRWVSRERGEDDSGAPLTVAPLWTSRLALRFDNHLGQRTHLRASTDCS